MTRKNVRSWIVLTICTAGFVALLYPMGLWEAGLRVAFPDPSRVLYPDVSLLQLVWEHVRIVAISSGLALVVGVPLGIAVTRVRFRQFLPLVEDVTTLGQTFPPVAVLALAAPVIGFETSPTIVALFLYGLLPIVRNTVAGLRSVPAEMTETAVGMGMDPMRRLLWVELPLSARVILAGARISVVINIGTAMIGPLVGAGGLGVPVTAGLAHYNPAYILEGAIPAALLAFLADRFFAVLEGTLAPRDEQQPVVSPQ